VSELIALLVGCDKIFDAKTAEEVCVGEREE